MVSEEMFALEEKKMGKKVHLHDGVWWIKSAPFYYKPVHEFRPIPCKSLYPDPLKSLGGYSYQLSDSLLANRYVRHNMLQGDSLRAFSLERISGKRRNMVRMGIRYCRIEFIKESDVLLEQMRLINISQAKRFERGGGSDTFLPSDYYELHVIQWKAEIQKYFIHKGHQFVGAFVGETLVAYIDLIQLEDTWMFGAVKSSDEYLKYRPVDALYYTILTMASQCDECKRVVNGGGYDERDSLTYFKREYLLTPVDLPYYSRTLLPVDLLRGIKNKIMSINSKVYG